MTLQVAHFASSLEHWELQVFPRQAGYPISGVTWRPVIAFSHLDHLVQLSYNQVFRLRGSVPQGLLSSVLHSHVSRASIRFLGRVISWRRQNISAELQHPRSIRPRGKELRHADSGWRSHKGSFLFVRSIWNLWLGYSQVRSKFSSLESDFCPLTLWHPRISHSMTPNGHAQIGIAFPKFWYLFYVALFMS